MQSNFKAILAGIGGLIALYLIVRWGPSVVQIVSALANASVNTISVLQGNPPGREAS